MRYLDQAHLYFKSKKQRRGYLLPNISEMLESTEQVVEKIEEQVPQAEAPPEVQSPQLTGDEELEDFQASLDVGEGELEEEVQEGPHDVEPELEFEDPTDISDEELVLEESVGNPQKPTLQQTLPESVMHRIQTTDTDIEDVLIISSNDDYWQARDQWGMPDAINESGNMFGVFGGRAGSIFVDDMNSGKVKAYSPSEFPTDRIRR
jgi:hypothetical protein